MSFLVFRQGSFAVYVGDHLRFGIICGTVQCRKTKTKVITLANRRGHRQSSEQIKTRSNFMKLTQSAGKCVRGSQLVLVLLLIGWREFLKPCGVQNVWRTKRKTNCFSTLKWKPLYLPVFIQWSVVIGRSTSIGIDHWKPNREIDITWFYSIIINRLSKLIDQNR